MLDWGQIIYGAVLSAVTAGALIALVMRPRRLSLIATGALAGGLGPLAWNAILRATEGRSFFIDAPVSVFPVSWQDTGSGVFAVAVAAVLLGFGPLRTTPGRQVGLGAVLCGAAALVIDVYLY